MSNRRDIMDVHELLVHIRAGSSNWQISGAAGRPHVRAWR